MLKKHNSTRSKSSTRAWCELQVIVSKMCYHDSFAKITSGYGRVQLVAREECRDNILGSKLLL
jgi:hypothetical protein